MTVSNDLNRRSALTKVGLGGLAAAASVAAPGSVSAASMDAELLAINARYRAAQADVMAVKGDYPADYDFIDSNCL